VDCFGYGVLRRGTRRGFKAGNLNHWLDLYGTHYTYFVVLDSDSSIPDDFITRLVEYAEHLQNKQVAVFQSKILTWNVATPMQCVLGVLAPLQMYILERVANRTGTLLSLGHNTLIRTECVQQVGGFHEYVTAEDIALTLMLSREGYAVKLVDIISYDTKPRDVYCYARRTIRWAKQTVEMFRLPWQSAAFPLKLVLCHRLYSYVIHNVYFGLLLLAAWASFSADNQPLYSLAALGAYSKPSLALWFVMLLIIPSLWTTQVMLRFVLAKKAGVSGRDFLLYILLSTSLMYFMAFPVTRAMLETVFGAKTSFIPTNTKSSVVPTLPAIVNRMLPFLVYGGLVLIGVALNNRGLLFSLNGFWLLLLLIAPLVLWLFHSRGARIKGDIDHGL
jgi:cellulose synthase/poly-beta-1,6-N-acetylglucosamine synthase-like glycosyltransferase